jgi:hypothetical protein
MRGLPAAVLRGEAVTTAWGLRLSSVFRVPFCPRPGFQKRLSTSIRVVPNAYLVEKLRQKLRQIACRKDSKTASRLRVILKKTNVLRTLHLPC